MRGHSSYYRSAVELEVERGFLTSRSRSPPATVSAELRVQFTMLQSATAHWESTAVVWHVATCPPPPSPAPALGALGVGSLTSTIQGGPGSYIL